MIRDLQENAEPVFLAGTLTGDVSVQTFFQHVTAVFAVTVMRAPFFFFPLKIIANL